MRRIISSPYAAFQQEVNERLPFSPYFSWSWNVRYEAPLNANLKGYAQFDMTHKGDMWNDLNPNSTFTGIPRILQPPYILMNVRFGLNPAGGHWLAELYVTNIADKNAIVYSNTGNYDLRLTTNEPRVYGLRVNYRFGKEVNYRLALPCAAGMSQAAAKIALRPPNRYPRRPCIRTSTAAASSSSRRSSSVTSAFASWPRSSASWAGASCWRSRSTRCMSG